VLFFQSPDTFGVTALIDPLGQQKEGNEWRLLSLRGVCSCIGVFLPGTKVNEPCRIEGESKSMSLDESFATLSLSRICFLWPSDALFEFSSPPNHISQDLLDPIETHDNAETHEEKGPPLPLWPSSVLSSTSTMLHSVLPLYSPSSSPNTWI